jgi:predicted nucleic acid-binding protein
MKKLKIYIDTSVISHLQADDVPEKMTITHEFWKCLVKGEYEAYISELVVAEFNNCPEPKKSKLEIMLQHAPLEELEIDDEVTILADRYMEEGLFPSKYRDDAIHVALASAFGCNVVVSWNFKHMVKIKTILGVNGINKIMGYSDIEIVTPEVVIGEEEDENE